MLASLSSTGSVRKPLFQPLADIRRPHRPPPQSGRSLPSLQLHQALLAGAALATRHLCNSGHSGRKSHGSRRIRNTLRHAVRRVYEFFSGVGGMRLAFQEAMLSKGPLPLWRSFEVDETCCKAYCDLYGSKYITGVKRNESWKGRRDSDELWRCSIDRLPDEAFEGGDLWLMSPPCQPFTRTGRRLKLHHRLAY